MKGELISAVERDGEQYDFSELPQHMKEFIFEKLPLQSISRSRAVVCREWNTLLSSHSFLSSLPTHNPWLLLCGERHCMAYCFSAQKWRTISLSFLPFPFGNDFGFYILSSSVQVLLLRYTPQLYVCNPLMRTYNEIDINMGGRVMGIVQGGNREPYLVVKLEDTWTFSVSLQIYHYFQDSWRIKFEDAVEQVISIYHNEMVECNGVLFWSTGCPITIVACSIQDDSFIKPVKIAEFPIHLVIGDNMIEGEMKSFMVAYGLSVLTIVVIKDLSKPMKIVIMELFRDEKDPLFWKWREFVSMPPASVPQYLEMSYESSWQWGCVGVGDCPCFSCVGGVECPKVAAYNLREGLWQCLPQCPGTNFFKMMSFEPKLMGKV